MCARSPAGRWSLRVSPKMLDILCLASGDPSTEPRAPCALRSTVLGVAMPGSARETVDAADLVLPEGCEDDGVARWIERMLAAR